MWIILGATVDNLWITLVDTAEKIHRIYTSFPQPVDNLWITLE